MFNLYVLSAKYSLFLSLILNQDFYKLSAHHYTRLILIKKHHEQ